MNCAVLGAFSLPAVAALFRIKIVHIAPALLCRQSVGVIDASATEWRPSPSTPDRTDRPGAIGSDTPPPNSAGSCYGAMVPVWFGSAHYGSLFGTRLHSVPIKGRPVLGIQAYSSMGGYSQAATRRPSNAILGVDSLDADGRAGRSPSSVADAVTKMPQARANGCEQVREAARPTPCHATHRLSRERDRTNHE